MLRARLVKAASTWMPVSVLMACQVALSAGTARAASITVTSTADVLSGADGLCTLREAIIAANSNAPSGAVTGECPAGTAAATDTIVLANGATYSLTLSGGSEDSGAIGDLDIADNAGVGLDVILGVAGGGTATISQDASPDDRVLHVLSGATVQIDGVTVTGGGNVALGGGIAVDNGNVTLNNSTVSSNAAGHGAGIYSTGTLVLDGSEVASNSALLNGGGIYVSAGTLTATGTRFLANAASISGGAMYNAANVSNAVSITGSCIVNNTVVAVHNTAAAQQSATGNWWGVAAGPGPVGPSTNGDTVSPNVDFSGFLTAPILGCPNNDPDSVGALFTVTPCRVLDTRTPQGGPVLTSGNTRVLALHGVCGIPASARAVALSVAVTEPTGAGFVTLFPADANPVPPTSTINFTASQTRAGNAVMGLAGDGSGELAALAQIAGSGTVHLVVDVSGYFE